MRKMEIAMAMICQVNQYHLQHRTGPERIGATGLVGCFGGKIKVRESPRAAVSRELAQETNIRLEPEDYRFLDTVNVESDHNLEPVEVKAHVFEVLLPYGYQILAKEGELVTWTEEEIIKQEEQLTPATKEFFKGYFA